MLTTLPRHLLSPCYSLIMDFAGADSRRRRAQRRKPLGDVTNVSGPSSTFFSSPVKYCEPGPGLTAKPHSREAPGEISAQVETASVGSCISGDLDGSSPVAENLAGSGNLESPKDDILRRKRKRKNKWKKDVDLLQSSCPPDERIRNTGGHWKILREVVDHHGSCSASHQRPKMKWRYTMAQAENKRQFKLPRDFIKDQKAYFAEIDAFELPEEVVSESDME